MHISEMQSKIKKKCFVWDVMAFEIVVVNSSSWCRNTCRRQLIR